jgi:UDP-glucose 4-epimerase
MSQDLLIFGASSYVGRVFADRATATAKETGSDTTIYSLSSADCNLLDAEHVNAFFRSLPKRPYQAVIFSVINKSVSNSHESMLANMAMMRNFVAASRGTELTSLLYISSVDVYGVPTMLPLTEDSAIAPDTAYGQAKYNCEQILFDTNELSCPRTIVRIPGIFGKAQNDRSIIGKIVDAAHAGRPFNLVNGGKVLRDYVWVSDLARLLQALLPLRHEGVVNAVTGVSYRLTDIVDMVSQTLDIKIQTVTTDGDKDREFDLCFDNAHLRTLLPDFSFSELKAGIRSYAI